MNNPHLPLNSLNLTPSCQGRGDGWGERKGKGGDTTSSPAVDSNFICKIHSYSNQSANYSIRIFIKYKSKMERTVSFCRLSKSQQTLITPFWLQSQLLTFIFYCIASICNFHEAWITSIQRTNFRVLILKIKENWYWDHLRQ